MQWSIFLSAELAHIQELNACLGMEVYLQRERTVCLESDSHADHSLNTTLQTRKKRNSIQISLEKHLEINTTFNFISSLCRTKLLQNIPSVQAVRQRLPCSGTVLVKLVRASSLFTMIEIRFQRSKLHCKKAEENNSPLSSHTGSYLAGPVQVFHVLSEVVQC